MHISNILASLLLAGSAAAKAPLDPKVDYSSGAQAILSRIEDEDLSMSRIAAASIGAARLADDGSYTTCLPVYGGANATDCNVVLDNIASNTQDIGVVHGWCLNWWSGDCMAKVCATSLNQEDPYYEKPEVVVNRLRGDALNVCIKKGDSAAISDCEDYAGACGTYRYYLQKKVT